MGADYRIATVAVYASDRPLLVLALDRQAFPPA
jgi:hypothetical protein